MAIYAILFRWLNKNNEISEDTGHNDLTFSKGYEGSSMSHIFHFYSWILFSFEDSDGTQYLYLKKAFEILVHDLKTGLVH